MTNLWNGKATEMKKVNKLDYFDMIIVNVHVSSVIVCAPIDESAGIWFAGGLCKRGWSLDTTGLFHSMMSVVLLHYKRVDFFPLKQHTIFENRLIFQLPKS